MGVFKAKGSPWFQYAFTAGGVRYRGSTGLDRRADAEAWLAGERRRIILGIENPETMTLSQAFAKYELEHLQFKAAYASIRQKINHVLAFFGEATPLSAIDQNALERYVAHCKSGTFRRQVFSPRRGGMKPVGKPRRASDATINRRLSAFRAVHAKARKSWKVQVAEVDFSALMLREALPFTRTLAPESAQQLWDAAPPHLRHFIMVSLSTGWRMSNVLTLTGAQIDLAGRVMRTVGKGGKRIETPITDALAQYIIAHGLHQKIHVCAQMFKNGRAREVRSIKTAWKTLFKKTGLPPLRIHDLRHTFGTWLYAHTRDQRAVQEALAHSDIKTSIRYTHATQDMLREQMNRVPVRITSVGVVK